MSRSPLVPGDHPQAPDPGGPPPDWPDPFLTPNGNPPPLAGDEGFVAPPPPPTRAARGAAMPRFSLILVAVLAGTALFLGGYSLGSHVASTPGTPAADESKFGSFWDVYYLIRDRFAGTTRPTTDQLVVAAIKGMMESLDDPFSFYHAPDDFQNALLDVGGKAEGIGVVVQVQPISATNGPTECPKIGDGCELAIVRPIPGSPAAAAGIQPGDVIVAADGVKLDGLTVDQATSKIKGPKGTQVRLTLDRGGQSIDITITRNVYNQPEVDTRTLADGAVEYIEIVGINPPASSQFKDALTSALAAGRRSFVIDLRGDPGGYVEDAVTMASQFIGSGVLAYQQDASGTQQPLDAKTGGLATDPSIHVVVLMDPNTASAAEILAGALQGRGRALLVGEHSYGKGVVQEWLPLSDNLGGIQLTIARWLTPKKVWIQGKGLQPDVPATNAGARAGTDPVLDAGLRALGYPPATTPSASPAPGTSQAPGASPAPGSGSSPATSPTPLASPVPS